MKRLFSGMQPTGAPHIGNYLGAIEKWVELQEEYESIFCIVDLHSMTIDYDVSVMNQRIMDMATVLLASGLRAPEQCTLFVQSQVPEHALLSWLFSTVTPLGELYRMTQFKAKAQEHKKNINSGLLTYPILQAADIALYKGEVVPVGEDQVQHVELSRIIVRKFNNRFGEVFPEPVEKVSPAKRIMGLDGQAKMSKSLNNYVEVLEEPEAIWGKLKTAMTDPARRTRKDAGNPDVCNIHSLHGFFSTAEQISWVRQGCCTAGIGCFECKKVLADKMAARFAPIRERAAELRGRPGFVAEVLAHGADRCRRIAAETMKEAYEAAGLSPGRLYGE